MLGTITITVGQRESEDVGEKDSAKEMAANADVVQDTAEDGQEDLPEIIEQVPSSESNLDELTQPTESQSNDVGFKKVFKFVGFKFTVKKDKSEKSDAVQLLTVKKDEAEGEEGSRGAGDHQEASLEAGGEAAPKDRERKAPLENAEDTVKSEQQSEDKEARPNAEADSAAEESKEGGDERRENEASKAPESPTSPTANETASPFKKFFTQGWAGWRKKTSFRKPKEDEVEAAEKKKEQEAGKVAPEENGKAEATAEQPQASEQPPAQEERGSVHDARLSAEYEKIELPCDEQADGVRGPSEERAAPLATEVFDKKVEIVAEVHARTEEQKTGADEAVASLPPEKSAETTAQVQAAEPAEEVVVMTREASVPGEDQAQPTELSPEEKASSQPPEGIVSEVELLSTQERTKVQGSPLKKLFSSTGLKKLSGKKQKGKRGAPAGEEEPGEPSHIPPAESPDSTDDQKGESSASSPEEPEEITCLEKGIADAPADGDAEEGATSDGEKKREGVTPWASFKKMVTPKKRVRRPSESDKEDEPEKTKSATLSSTESAASEVQEDVKASAEEQRPEEPKRKVDTSVSWEALICVGSSKKRARKASSSDDEGGPQTMAGDIPKPEEAGKDKEPGTDPIPAIPPEHDHGPGSSSPEQAGSPSEGEGVSTWESFKRLVTARKKSKSKLEEKNEDSLPGTGAEPSASDVELGKEESWVSIKKFIPGRKKKRLDGKQEQATLEDTGPAEVNEEDSDVPAVVPLSEYDAVEREKIEAQQAQKRAEKPAPEAPVYVSEELSKSLVHTVAVTVIDGTRAVTSMEERSPSWISASVTDQPEQGEDTAKRSGEEREEGEAIAEVPTGTKTLPESKEARADMVASEMALTSGAVTAAETTEAFGAEEATEASGAEETTEMVSAVSQLTDTPDTTEEATPVQEVEGDVLDLEGLGRRTQAVLQAVAEKVREESQLPDSLGPEDPSQATQKAASKILEKVEEAEEESTGLDVTEEMDSGLQVQVQETKTEDVQGKLTVQTTPERPPKGPEAPESVECSGLESPPAVETSGEVKSQEITRGQAITPDSVETLSDSEPTGSAPVAEFETLNAAQPDQVGEIHDGGEVVPHAQSEPTEAEAGPVQKEGRLFPPSCQSQEDGKDSCRPEEVLEQADKEASVETVATLSKTEVISEADDRADEKTKDTPLADGVEGSTDTERMASQNQIAEGEPKDKVTPAAESEENALCADSLEVQPLSSPVQSETRVQAEGEKIETPPAQANGEKLEQTPARTVQAAPTVTGTVVDGENEVAGVGGSAPCLVSEETVSTEVQVQSSDAPLTPPVTAAEDRVIGATIEIVEAGAETLQSAEKPFAPEEKPSDEDQDSTARASKDAMPPGTGAPAEAGPDTVCADPDRDQTTPQEQMADKDPGQVVSQEVKGNMLGEEDSRAGSEVLAFESESGHLVHNVIEIAVGQFVSSAAASPELHPAGSEPQAQGDKADHPDAEKEDREPLASAQDETQSTAPKDEPEAATPSSVSTDQSDGAETIVAVEGEGSGAKGPEQLEGAALPSDAKSDVAGTRSVPEDAEGATSEPGGKTEESLLESEGAEKGAAVETQDPVPRGTDASGDLRRGTPDTNGPKLNKEEEEDGQGEEFQKGPVQSASEKETKTQPQEETQKPEREAEKPDELPESTDIV
ncbi:A-kinase anchor protein 12 isoform X1 [Echinops telfairi]|uniref:A-kinase anchor protein 12 isoform X1 n=1 Tax=Echinops telfairi TaxID=9371 RepID=A0AC55DF56_ECHTE|nr:A-kinase anchor protein 12 isoform X1 [Echinops telfairi]